MVNPENPFSLGTKGQRSRSQGINNNYMSVFRRNAILTLAAYVTYAADSRFFRACSFAQSASGKNTLLVWVITPL